MAGAVMNPRQPLGGRLLGRLSSQHRAGLMGVGWSSLSQLVSLTIRLGSTLVLTRLLAPEAYGIIGSAMAILTTLEWLSDLGVQPALVRHPQGDQRPFLDTGWLIGVGRGAGLSLAAAGLAWPLAAFYNQPELLGVLLVMALRPALMALRSPDMPLLKRRLDYRALFIDETAQTLLGTAASLGFACLWPSAWAIVAGTLAGAAAGVVASYLLCPRRPAFSWDPSAARAVRSLGGQVFLNTLVMALWLNADRLLGLRFVAPAEMGLYMVAWNLASAVEALLTRSCDVHYSMLCRLPGAEEQHAWHERVCSRTAWLAMPLLALAVVAAPIAVRIVYDVRYRGAGVVFSVLLARLMIRTLGQVQFQYLMARARVNLATYAYGVALAVQAICLVPLIVAYGAVGMAVCALLSTVALTGFQTWLLARESGGGWRHLGVALGWTAVGLGVVFGMR
jgi:O-antigen/teichoic acid export membrane protein